MSVRQVRPHKYFPSGDSRALIEVRFDPDELSERYKLTFEETYDDLDWYKLAAIELPNDSQAWFIKYRGEQGPGTVVYVDAGADFAGAKEQVKQALDLTEDDFLWMAPGAQASAAIA